MSWNRENSDNTRSAKPHLPDFIIIGAQKSGTTFLQKCLSSHPLIGMVPGETEFFEDPDYAHGSLRELEHAVSAWVNPSGIGGIKCPTYLPRPECPRRIRADLPRVRLVAVLRDPIERAISAYFHYLRWGYLPLIPLNIGIEKILNSELDLKWPRSHEIVEFGMYARHLGRYLSYFDKEDIYVVTFGRMVADFAGVMMELLSFLGLPDEHAELAKPLYRTGTACYSPHRLKFNRLRNNILYTDSAYYGRKIPKSDFTMLRRSLFKATTAFDELILARVFRREKPKLAIPLRDRLVEMYHEDSLKINEMFDVDIGHWTTLA